jgi:hypothetical protein
MEKVLSILGKPIESTPVLWTVRKAATTADGGLS